LGQILEYIAPNVDFVCPMIYPSHFPKGFNGWKIPNSKPKKVILESMKKAYKKRFFPIYAPLGYKALLGLLKPITQNLFRPPKLVWPYGEKFRDY